MKKAVLVIVLGLVNTIYAFATLLNIFISELVDKESIFDGYGYDFSGNELMVVWLISGIIVLAIGLMMYKDFKKENN